MLVKTSNDRRRGRIIRVIAVPVLVYLAWCALLFFMQSSFMFPSGLAGEAADGPWTPDADVITRPIGSNEQTVAWYFPVRHATADAPAPIAVYFHGNAELIDHQQEVVERYHAMGIAVLLVEYRGYGHAGGSPSERAIVEDALHFIDSLLERPEVDGDALILHGRSIGGAVAAQVAARHQPAMLILVSTFTHAGAFTWRYGVPPVLLKNRFDTRDVLADLDCRVLLFHGEDDAIIPASHSRSLHDRSSEASLHMVADAGHNDFPGVGQEHLYWGVIRTATEHIGE